MTICKELITTTVIKLIKITCSYDYHDALTIHNTSFYNTTIIMKVHVPCKTST